MAHTAKRAMAAHLGCDTIRELEDGYRYQPKPGEKRPIYKCDDYEYTYGPSVSGEGWERDPDQFHAMRLGTTIWRKLINP